MRHSRGIDLEPDTRGAYPDGIGHLRLADLGEEQILGARCSKCDHNQWVDRWGLAGKYGHEITLDELRPMLRCTRCGNTAGNGFRVGRIDRDSEWVDVQSVPHRSRI